MLAGHFATALVAKQHAPRGHLVFYLLASQLPDLLWLVFHYLGLEVTHPDNMLAGSLDSLSVQMTYSHHLLPTLGWTILVTLAGRTLFGTWRPALAGGTLVVVHALADYLAGHPHHVFGPDSPLVATGMYQSAPYVAVAVEAVFTAAVLASVLRTDARCGVRRSPSVYRTWAVVFGGGVAFMFVTAERSMADLFGVEPPPWLADTLVPFLLITYLAMMVALARVGAKPPLKPATDRAVAPASAGAYRGG